MSTVLYVSTMILNFAGIAFAAVYVWLNVFSKITDLSDRNASVLKITRTSVVLTMAFALLSCLLSNSGEIEAAIQRTTTLYTVVAISWLVVLLLCGIAMIFSLVSKKTFKAELAKSVKKIFVIALWGSIVAMVLSWLFS